MTSYAFEHTCICTNDVYMYCVCVNLYVPIPVNLDVHESFVFVCVEVSCTLCTCKCAFIDSVDIDWWEEKNLLLLSQYSNHRSMHSFRSGVSPAHWQCTWSRNDHLPNVATLDDPLPHATSFALQVFRGVPWPCYAGGHSLLSTWPSSHSKEYHPVC